MNDDVIMDNNAPVKVNSIKYLDVIVDNKLNWIDHITYVKNKISNGLGIMYKATHSKDDETDIWPSTYGRFWKEMPSHHLFSVTYQPVGVDYTTVV